MLSYAEKVREEIYSSKPSKSFYYKGFCYGLMLFGKRFDSECISITTEHLPVSKLYGFCIHDCSTVRAAFTDQNASRGKRLFSLALTDKEAIAKIFNLLGHSPSALNRELMEGDFFPSFLCGVFLACGAVSDPEKAYSLEFCAPNDALCDLLFEILSTEGYPPKSTLRRGQTVLYYKESAQIEDILTTIGAVKCSLELMETKIYKDLRNRANRSTNCETANIFKMVKASVAQIDDINFLEEQGLLETLPVPLVETAKIRQANPEAPLSELADILSVPRSTVNNRLGQLAKAARKAREE